jgi:DNA-binding transcriptional ArsR family regulator
MDTLSRTFSALADPTRRAILARLATGAATVGEIAEPFDMSLPAVSKHIRVLESAGLVVRTIEGRIHTCALDGGQLRGAAAWLDHYRAFWDDTLASLAAYAERAR